MREKQVPQHLSMVAAHDKAVTLARLSVADKLGIRRGFAGGWTDRGGGQQPGFTIPPGHVITHIGDTDRGFGTYMETFPAENVEEAKKIGMVSRNLHPDQFREHT